MPARTAKRGPPVDRYPGSRAEAEGLSVTELVILCQRKGIKDAFRGWAKDALIDALLGNVVPAAGSHPVETRRDQIYAYVQRRRATTGLMPSLASCNFNCPTCPALQVLECFAHNKDLLKEPA